MRIGSVIWWLLIASLAVQAQEVTSYPSNQPDDTISTIEPPWDWLQLTGTYMKPEIPILVPIIKEKFRLPWWIPVTGWAAAGGVTSYWLTQKKKDKKQESLIAVNDNEVIECEAAGILLDVLKNDQGTELTILSVDNVIGAELIIQQNNILVSNPSDQLILFNYTVGDKFGNASSAEVMVQVKSSSLQSVDDHYETSDIHVEGNLLDNDLGINIELVHYESPPDGNLVIAADGQFSYTRSTRDSGRIQFLYVIEDKCKNRDTAICLIEIKPPPCEIESSFETTMVECGRADGSAVITVNSEGEYQYAWPDGNNLAARSDLAAGLYDVVINSEYCEDTISIQIVEKPTKYDLQAVGVPGNCVEGGDIDLTFDHSLDGDLAIAVTGPSGSSEYTTNEKTAVSLSAYTSVLPGSYTVEIWNTLSGRFCSQTVQVLVPDNTTELKANNDVYTTGFMTAIEINVLSNDMGLSLVMTGIKAAIGGQAVLSEDGQVVFTPENGFSGEASFRYTVADGCGREQEAEVVIEVGLPECNLTTDISLQMANCGRADGSAEITVLPAGNYQFSWPNGSTLSSRTDLNAGIYDVVISSEYCKDTVSIEIKEEPADYDLQGIGMPGNCVEGGDIELTFDHSLDGDLIIGVTGPSGIGEYATSEKNGVSLSTYTMVLPGSYTVEIWNAISGRSCSQTIQVLVPDNTPELIANNDAYTTGFMTPIEFNVFSNDMGLGIKLSGVKAILNGQVEYSENGMVNYTPDDGFSGETSFRYKVTDICGREEEAQVTIVVGSLDCTMTAGFSLQSASCGRADGSAVITISPSGNYQYVWSDGSIGSELKNVAPGNYSVNVSRIGTTCQKSFGVVIGEKNTDYIKSIQSNPIDCLSEGDIVINLNVPPGEQLVVEVNSPEENFVFSTNSSQIKLSDHVPIVVGEYMLKVNDGNGGIDCRDERTAIIQDNRRFPKMELTDQSPPSSPSSADGRLTVQIIGQTNPPYRLFLNGQMVGIYFGGEITLDQMSYGEHKIYIVDINGCQSNVLLVNFTDTGMFQIHIETGYVTSYLPVQQDEHSDEYNPYIHLRSRLKGVYHYRNQFLALSAGYGMVGFTDIDDRILQRYETTFSKGFRKNWFKHSIDLNGGVVWSTVTDLQHFKTNNQQYGVFLGSTIHRKKSKIPSSLLRLNFEGYLFFSNPLYSEFRCSIGF